MRLFIVLIAFFSVNVSIAQDLYVNAATGNDANNGTTPATAKQTIQAAINTAAPNQSIQVASGSYNGFVVNKSITLIGNYNDRSGYANGRNVANETIVNGSVTFNENINNISISGFYFKNNVGDLPVGSYTITSSGNTNVLISDNIIENRADIGIVVEKAISLERGSAITIRNNFLRNVGNGITINDCDGVTIEYNMLGNRTLDNIITSIVVGYGIIVGENCANINILYNQLKSILHANANKGTMLLYPGDGNDGTSGLNGNLLVQGNFIDNSATDGIYFRDQNSNYDHEFIEISENFFARGLNCIYTGNLAPAGRTLADGNFWNTGAEPSRGINGSSIYGSGFNSVRATVWLVGFEGPLVNHDTDPDLLGFQSEREVSFIHDEFTLQEALDAVPLPDERGLWQLSVGFGGGLNFEQDISISINNPLILSTYNAPAERAVITSSVPSPQVILINSDDVIVRDLEVRVHANTPIGIASKGIANVQIINIRFRAENGIANFTHLLIDSEKANPPYVQNSIRVVSSDFMPSNVAGGYAIQLLNGNLNVQDQPLPTFRSIEIGLDGSENTFNSGFNKYIYLDGTPDVEFNVPINISQNSFKISGVFNEPGAMNLQSRFNLEDLLVHGIDIEKVSLLIIEENHLYITPNSFEAPFIAADMDRAFALAQSGNIIHVKTGNYDEPFTASRSVQIQPENNVVFADMTVDGTENNAPVTIAFNNTITLSQRLSLSKGYLDTENLILIAPNARVEGGGEESYVRGKLALDQTGIPGPFNLNFPIGSGSRNYRPVQINNLNAANPIIAFTTKVEATGGSAGNNLDVLLSNRYWSMEVIAGNMVDGTLVLNYAEGDGVNTQLRMDNLTIGLSATLDGVYDSLHEIDEVGGSAFPVGDISADLGARAVGNYFLALGVFCPGNLAPAVLSINTNEVVSHCENISLDFSVNNPLDGATYTLTGPGGFSANGTSFSIPANILGAVGNESDFQINYVNETGCPGGVTLFTVRIVEQPDATFAYPENRFCTDNVEPLIPVIQGVAGVFTSDQNGISLDENTGVILINQSQPGTYQISNTIPSENNCTVASHTFEISIFAPVTAQIRGENEVFFCNGEQVLLEAEQRADYTYQWLRNGQIIEAETGVSLSTNIPGSYTLQVSNICGLDISEPVVVQEIQIPSIEVSDIDEDFGVEVELRVIVNNPTGTEVFSWEPINGLSDPTSASPVLTVTENITYTVTVSVGPGCTTSAQINVSVGAAEVFIPTAFSPNGDGSNERFLVYGLGISEIDFKIYDRLGALLYETSSVEEATQNGWDGRHQGKPVKSGVYVWYLNGKKVDGTDLKFNGKHSGTIMLIR